MMQFFILLILPQVCQTVQEQACHQEQQCSALTETVTAKNHHDCNHHHHHHHHHNSNNHPQVVDTTTYEECEDVITKVCTNTQVSKSACQNAQLPSS